MKNLFSIALIASTLDVTIQQVYNVLGHMGLVDDSWSVTEISKGLLEQKEIDCANGDIEWTETVVLVTPKGFIRIIEEVYHG